MGGGNGFFKGKEDGTSVEEGSLGVVLGRVDSKQHTPSSTVQPVSNRAIRRWSVDGRRCCHMTRTHNRSGRIATDATHERKQQAKARSTKLDRAIELNRNLLF